MYHGIINVYKEKGWTSFDVVAKLRGICGQKKIGHTGTLDPDAEGVLPVCLGNATKISGMLTDRDKTYRAVLLLGIDTDTQDITGQVLKEHDTDDITEEMVRDTIAGFVGEQEQIPPMYSALKVDGKKLYELARKGQTVSRDPREITIYEIEINSIKLPRITMTVRCSKGTYIRTLCHDIGERLGCFGTMEQLTRLSSAGFEIEDALRLDDIVRLQEEGRLAACIHPVEEMFSDSPAVRTKRSADRLLYNGNRIPAGQIEGSLPEDSQIRMRDSAGVFCGIYRCDDPDQGCYPVRMFLPDERDTDGKRA
ncbi:MAG: tRNA pseudouridine(55) synthase TruB [Lachnospiraceae bacterium]|nr:tRNA pseudouridine(55) synthase TruB [Lachnospiraceae bacterium]